LQPSARNPKAISVYQKMGFIIQKNIPKGMEADYMDAVYLIKKLV